MYAGLFQKFLVSGDTLQVYQGDRLVFFSNKDRLLPLLGYLDRFASRYRQVGGFDKIIGNAAALLFVRAGCREAYSPMGSQLAIGTLKEHGIAYYFTEIVPCIQRPDGTDMCPMERLSIGKEPEEFYQVMLNLVNEPRSQRMN